MNFNCIKIKTEYRQGGETNPCKDKSKSERALILMQLINCKQAMMERYISVTQRR